MVSIFKYQYLYTLTLCSSNTWFSYHFFPTTKRQGSLNVNPLGVPYKMQQTIAYAHPLLPWEKQGERETSSPPSFSFASQMHTHSICVIQMQTRNAGDCLQLRCFLAPDKHSKKQLSDFCSASQSTSERNEGLIRKCTRSVKLSNTILNMRLFFSSDGNHFHDICTFSLQKSYPQPYLKNCFEKNFDKSS